MASAQARRVDQRQIQYKNLSKISCKHLRILFISALESLNQFTISSRLFLDHKLPRKSTNRNVEVKASLWTYLLAMISNYRFNPSHTVMPISEQRGASGIYCDPDCGVIIPFDFSCCREIPYYFIPAPFI